MMLSDTDKNTTFKYLFVKNFRWENILDTEKFEGHPKAKTVYRASFNSDTRGYRLFYKQQNGQMHGVILHSLNGHPGGYESEIVEVTKDNILDLEVSEADLDKLIEWQTTGNRELRESYGFTKPVQQPQNMLIPSPDSMKAMLQKMDLQKEATDFLQSAQQLHMIDNMSFESVHMIIDHLNEVDHSDNSFDAVNLTYSKVHGSGHNVGKALNLLSVYMSDDKRENLDRDDLIAAIGHLIMELNRINYHNIE